MYVCKCLWCEYVTVWAFCVGTNVDERRHVTERESELTCMILAGLTFNLVQESRWTKFSFKPGTLANWPLWILCISLLSIPSIASQPNTVPFLPSLKRLGLVPSTLEWCKAEIIDLSCMHVHGQWFDIHNAFIWHLPGVKDKLLWTLCHRKKDLWSYLE